jgi:hypothetical protein
MVAWTTAIAGCSVKHRIGIDSRKRNLFEGELVLLDQNDPENVALRDDCPPADRGGLA